jgi:hypothetical protein
MRAILASLLLLFPHTASAADVTDVLSRMRRAVEPPGDMRAAIEFMITNAEGESVHWTGSFYRMDGPSARMRIVLENPLDLRGVSVTVRRVDGVPDPTRVYLPSIRRVRQLAGDLRGEAFLGTDFNYEDLGLVELDFQAHALTGEERVAGRPCYQVESVPARGWWYRRIVRCIDKKDYLPRRTEYYDPSGLLFKVRTFDRVATVGGHPTPVELTMEVVPARTSSRIILRDIEYDVGLTEKLFEAP